MRKLEYLAIAIFAAVLSSGISITARLRRSFWFGFVFACMVMALIQDWFGRDAWIEYISEDWIHMHWAWWIPAILVCLALHFGNQLGAKVETDPKGTTGLLQPDEDDDDE